MEHADTDALDRPRDDRCILVVEDEEAIRRVAIRALERSGYRVADVADGREALELLLRPGSSICLVVTDLEMAEMGGAELRRVAKGHGIAPPFLFTSGHGLDALRGAFDANERVAFLPKPWTLAALQRKVAEMLAEHEPGSRASQAAA
jgi:CheY-like chemotaxis protein